MANSPVIVKEPAGQYTSDFLKACEDNFSRVYPECLNSSDHGTIMCPAAFEFGYVSPRGEASGAIPTRPIEEAAFTGDAAELKIFDVLENFEGNTKQPMFVLSKFIFRDFAEQVLRKMLPADHPTLVKFLQSEGELDFVIVHRRIGVILIEVKAAQKFKKADHCTAKRQLSSGEEIIQAVIHCIGINIPVYKVIAMPNVSDPGRITPGFINLREINVGSHDDFQSWWTTHFQEVEFGSSEQEGIQKLIAILVGQRSAVSCRAKVLSNVFKKIDTQSFLKRSFDKRATVNGPDVVRRTANEQELSILARQFMFLNPEQQRIWNGPRRQFFCGVYGSGKTILIQFKALECAQNGENVVVMVPLQLAHLYNDFFEVNGVSSRVNVVSHIYEANDIFLRNDSIEFHFFADEWQLFLLRALEIEPGLLIWFQNALIGRSSYYCWIAYDDKECISIPLEFDLINRVQTYIQTFLCNGAFYHAASLTTNMRSTAQVYSHWKSTLKGEECRLKVWHEEAAHFPLERYWSYPGYLGHHICGPSVLKMPVPTNSFKGMIQVIKQEIESWAKDGEVYTFNKVAVLVISELHWLRKALHDEMRKERIPVCERGERCNGVVLEFGNVSHSYEWPVVIAICTRYAQENCLMFSRTVTRLVVLYVDPSYFSVRDGSAVSGHLSQ